MSSKKSIQVAIKVRPLLKKEKELSCCWRIVDNSIQLVESHSEPFYFDHIFDHNDSNQVVFDTMAKHIVHAGIQGFNGTIFAYGQTSSGKTYTMMGDEENPGVMVLAAKELFKEIEKATDRQFVLRVGYIEIYNEKIFDLLNKKNVELKILEIDGIVSVNCEDYIIRCEEELLYYLCLGNKQRTVGETNMNERSSRSHAIFRIIVESRKMDRKEDDAVTQSVLNLVDLAGSERADQTGARGARLKEGGHINKSLLFLSTVIKRLSENEDDKFISYRDSKLTRILQASLGGNALTSIICTIKPTAIEETQSTLSFALRAKTIKNKPQVNEIISDATMMKRLEKEIKELKDCLAKERLKNQSQIKVGQLEQRIKNEVLKIINSDSLTNMRNQREQRRRTWCPETTSNVATVQRGSSNESHLPKPTRHKYLTPLIGGRTLCSPPSNGTSFEPRELLENEEEEQFVPGEECDIQMQTPNVSPKFATNIILLTPSGKDSVKNVGDIEKELTELQEFTHLENKIDVQHELVAALKEQVEVLTQRNQQLENERIEWLECKADTLAIKQSFAESEKRCAAYKTQIDELTGLNHSAALKVAGFEQELAQLKAKMQQLEVENREVVSLEFEFERHKQKFKLRENELLEMLSDKQNEITKLEKSLKSVTDGMQHSGKPNFRRPIGHDDDASCAKCEQLQVLLEENRKMKMDFENLTLQYEQLQQTYRQAIAERASQIQAVPQANNDEECERLRAEIVNLRERLEHVQSEFCQLNVDKEVHSTRCEELNKAVLMAKEEVSVLQSKYAQLETLWQVQQQTIASIQSEYDAIQAKYVSLQTEYERMENLSTQSLADCARLQQENESLQLQIGELKQKVELVQQRLLEHSLPNAEQIPKTNNEQLTEQLESTRQQLSDLQREYDDLSNQLVDSVQEGDSLRSEYAKVLQQLRLLREGSAIDNMSLSATESSLGMAVEVKSSEHEVNERSSAVQISLQDEQGDEEVHSSRLSNSPPRRLPLKGKIKLNDEVESDGVSTKEAELQSIVCQLKAEKEALNEEKQHIIASTEKTVDELREQIERLSAELFEKTLSIEKCLCEEYQRQLTDMEQELSTVRGVVTHLESKCMVQTAHKIEEEVVNATLRTEDSAEVARLRLVQAELGSRIAELECELSLQEGEMKSMANLVTELRGQNEILSKSCDEAQADIAALQIAHEEKSAAAQCEIDALREDFQQKDNDLRNECARLQLELLEELELNETAYRENLRKYNQEWQTGKEAFERSIEDLQHQIKCLRAEKSEIEEDLAQKNCRVDELERQLETLQGEKSHLQIELTTLGHKVAGEQDLNALQPEAQVLKANAEAAVTLQGQLEALQADNLHLHSKLELLKETEEAFNDLQNQSKSLKADKLDLEAELESLKCQLDELQRINIVLLAQLTEKENASDELSRQLGVVKAEKSELQAELNCLQEAKTTAVSTALKEALANADKFERAVEELKTENAQLEATKQQVEKEYQDLLGKFKPLESEKVQHELYKTELEAKLRESELALSALSQRVKQLQKDCNVLKKEIAVVCKQKSEAVAGEMNQLLAILKASYASLEREKAELAAQLSLVQEAVEAAIKERGQQAGHAQQLSEQLQELRNENLSLKESIERLNTSLSNLRKAEGRLEHQLAEIQVAKEDNETKLQLLYKEKYQCDQTVEALQEKLSSMESLALERKEGQEKLAQSLRQQHEEALQTLQQEKASLATTIDEQSRLLTTFQDKIETLNLKVNDLRQELHEVQLREQAYKQSTADYEELKSMLERAQQEKLQLSEAMEELRKQAAEAKPHEAEMDQLQLKLHAMQDERDAALRRVEILQQEVDRMQAELAAERSRIERKNIELEGRLKEWTLKNVSLQKTREDLRAVNDELEQKLQSTCGTNDDYQKVCLELETLKKHYLDLQEQMAATVEEAARCSQSLQEELTSQKRLLQQKIDSNKLLRRVLFAKEAAFTEEKQKYEGTISCLMKEKQNLEERLFATEEATKRLEKELRLLQGGGADSLGTSEFNTSNSPRLRHSGDRLSDVALKNQQIESERKNRRLSAHDERRGVLCATGSGAKHCKCTEMEAKLKKCEMDLFIRESEVTALTMLNKHHPMEIENEQLKKRLMEEQAWANAEIKRYKQIIIDQGIETHNAANAATLALTVAPASAVSAATVPVAAKECTEVEVQTESDLETNLHNLLSKYNDLKTICRFRHDTIKELEEKIAFKENASGNVPSSYEMGQILALKSQCDSLKRDLWKYKHKYEDAKRVLNMRHEEIDRLKMQLNDNSSQ